ncbi:MAG TPA: phosphoribosyltransferase family protein [Nitrosopumilaceae archaeon]|jgi:predicted phosphoribosyltransferase
MTIIQNRKVAGQRLAEKIYKILKEEKPIVLAIPRGGVVVGEEIAKKLNCSLDVIISKKITPPSSPEYAIGAITHDGTIYYGQSWNNFSQEPNFDEEISKKKLEVKRRLEEYRGNANYKFNNKTVILVDDGIATGATVFVLLKWLSEKKVKHVILAVPVIPRNTYEEMKPLVDTIVALEIPVEFYAVGQFYKEFDQVSDKEVMTILNKFKNPQTVDNGIS